MDKYEILSNIKSPADVRSLSDEQTAELCSEIREKLIEITAENGGHLASNLGTVELTVALHKCFDSPDDSIIWDVGHQAYTHKLLTGRFELFDSLRKQGGISGFTRPGESAHDLFFSGHAGVAVSQAAGVAAANRLKGSKNYAVAVIGDGSFAGGMVYEALNSTGFEKCRLIVVLNDNEMSISENVGALAKNLARVRAKPEYYRFKAGTEKFLNKIPVAGKSLSRHLFKLKNALKHIIYSGSFIEDFGFRYVGPVDGHNVEMLCNAFNSAKMIDIPVLVHINTVKGKGYDFAENSPESYHGVNPFDKEKGESGSQVKTFSSVFSESLCSFAGKDKRICAVTAAMSIGTGLEDFASRFPERFFDVGIAEEHALTFCSGLAAGGMIPVFAVYSTFFQRCFDQLFHDGALQNRKMVIALDRAGFVGQDGETHQGLYDVSMLSGIPGVTVYSPASFDELNHDFYNAFYKDDGVVIIRYPKGGQPSVPDAFLPSDKDYDVFGNADSETAVVTYGRLYANLIDICSDNNCKLIKLNKIKPIPSDSVNAALKCKTVIFVEESVKSGSVGEQFASLLLESGFYGRFYHKAVNDGFIEQGTVDEQFEKYGLDSESLKKYISEILKG